jgi:glycosyltransferase involved in cell wall biosynthesis
MKVLHIVDTLDLKKGGISQAVQTMATEITQLGYYNEVLTLDKPGSWNKTFTFKIHEIGPSIRPWGYVKDMVPWLLDNMNKFTVVIVHGLWLYSSFAASRALKRYKKLSLEQRVVNYPKLFYMPHGMLDPYFQRSSGRRIKAIRNLIYWKLIEGQVVNSADGLLFTCKQECLLAHEPFSSYKPKREIIVGLGIEQPPIYNSQMQEAFSKSCPQVKNSSYIIFLGRIDQKKGIDILINAYQQLLVEQISKMVKWNLVKSSDNDDDRHLYIEACPKLVIAGPGLTSEFGREVINMVTKDPLLKSNIFFPGMLDGDSKWGAFYGSEAFILPSHQENFGIAVVEALACGKPVLISNQVNINIEILRAQAGIVEEDTTKGTYQMLTKWLAKSEVQRLEMQQKSKACFKEYFEINSAIQKLIKAISCQENSF